jgi:hypothetical protein
MTTKQRRRVGSGVLACLLGLAITPSAFAQSKSTPNIDGLGYWSLERLGYPEQDLTTGTPTASAQYTLPAGVRQGPRLWFVIHFHFRITISPDSGAGDVYVNAATADAVGSSVEFNVPVSGTAPVHWNTVDFIQGYRAHSTATRTIDVRNANYIPYRGVKAGLNQMTFQLQQYGSAKVESVQVFTDSALEWTKLGPARLGLRTSITPTKVRVGDLVAVHYRLLRSSGRPGEFVTLSIAPDEHAKVIGPRSVSYRRVAVPRRGSFNLRARSAGDAEIRLSVDSASSTPSRSLSFRISRRSGSGQLLGFGSWPLVACSAAVISLLAAAAARRSRRSSGGAS